MVSEVSFAIFLMISLFTEAGTTPNGIIVTEVNGMTRMVVGQTQPAAALLIYDDDGTQFSQTASMTMMGENGMGAPPEDSGLPTFCDGMSLYNEHIFASCSGGVRIVTASKK